MFEPQLIAELAALGLCAGFMAGLLGIGGGMMITPFMTMILAQRGARLSDRIFQQLGLYRRGLGRNRPAAVVAGLRLAAGSLGHRFVQRLDRAPGRKNGAPPSHGHTAPDFCGAAVRLVCVYAE